MRTSAVPRFVLPLALLPLALGCGLNLSGSGAPYTLGDPAASGDAGGGVSISGGGPGTGAALDAGDSALGAGDATDAGHSVPPPGPPPPDASVPAAPEDAGAVVDAAPGPDTSAPSYPASFPTVIGAWSFNEGAGTQSADLSGYGHPISLVGGASWAPGKEGSGLVLDGVTGYADIGSTLIDTTRSFSVVAWTQLAVVNTWQIAVSEGDVNGSLFALKLRGDGTDTFDFDVETSDDLNPGFVVARSVRVAQPRVWVQLAGVYDASAGGSVQAYVNGALESTVGVGQPLVAATGHFVLGRGLYNDVAGAYLHGTMDEVQVFDGALTAAQVATIFAIQQ